MQTPVNNYEAGAQSTQAPAVPAPGTPALYVFSVAQISNLRTPKAFGAGRGLPVGQGALQVGNLRYGRLEICATPRD